MLTDYFSFFSRQQVLQKLQSLEEWSSLSPIQQQQLFMQHMTMIPAHPPIPPTVPPSTAIPQTTQVSAPIPDPRIVAGPDPRILPGPAGPPSSKPQDPIQALVAQMVSCCTDVHPCCQVYSVSP